MNSSISDLHKSWHFITATEKKTIQLTCGRGIFFSHCVSIPNPPWPVYQLPNDGRCAQLTPCSPHEVKVSYGRSPTQGHRLAQNIMEGFCNCSGTMIASAGAWTLQMTTSCCQVKRSNTKRKQIKGMDLTESIFCFLKN